eukprot:GHVP01054022.1.p1 GENE.GHVP01054022.1~~GHVP01054022.1.p1  ORF type:complete len:139 (-),score=38.77 GHVP01054022.1:25-441(-)
MKKQFLLPTASSLLDAFNKQVPLFHPPSDDLPANVSFSPISARASKANSKLEESEVANSKLEGSAAVVRVTEQKGHSAEKISETKEETVDTATTPDSEIIVPYKTPAPTPKTQKATDDKTAAEERKNHKKSHPGAKTA